MNRLSGHEWHFQNNGFGFIQYLDIGNAEVLFVVGDLLTVNREGLGEISVAAQ